MTSMPKKLHTQSSYSSGKQAEDLAAQFLRNKGYSILEQNFRVPGGEIDLVTTKDGILVFVEVKMRRTHAFGSPEESVTPIKIRRILRAAYRYLQKNPRRKSALLLHSAKNDPSFRIDLLALDWKTPRTISVKHYQNILELL